MISEGFCVSLSNKYRHRDMKLKITIIFAFALMLLSLNESHAKKIKYEGTRIVAHRGYWNCDEAGYAKNSIAALRCAQQDGFWGSEFDVNMTSDGVLLVFHDDKIDGKKIEKHPHEDFKYYRLKNGEPIPTIDEYLEQAKLYPGTMLVYELKKHSCDEVEEKFVLLSIEKLKEHGLLDPSRVMFISFSKYICERLSQLLPEFDVQYLEGTLNPASVKKAGIRGIDYKHSVLRTHKKWVANARTLGMSTNSWTVNKEGDMKAILNMKIDMMTTDFPLHARYLMKRLGIKEIDADN